MSDGGRRPTGRPMRADALRNYERLRDVAAGAFAEHGAGASLEDIARRAGVGIGTLYRHFPTREALLDAVLCEHYEDMRARADALATDEPPLAALVTWLAVFAGRLTLFQGMAEEVTGSLHREGTAADTACHAMRDAAYALVTRAQEAGEIRPDVAPGDVLSLTAGIAWTSRTATDPGTRAHTLLPLLLNGLRPH